MSRGGMSGRAAATHGDAGPAKLLAHRGPGNAQLGTDLPQGPALAVQVGRTLNVHRDTVTSLAGSLLTGSPPFDTYASNWICRIS